MHRPRFTLADVVVVTVVAALFVGVGLPVASNARSYGNQCAANLRQLGIALLLYSQTNRGAYPRTRADVDLGQWVAYTGAMAPNPFADGGPAPNDVTAAMFLLLRTQQLKPDAFVCPNTTAIVPWNYGGRSYTAADRSNFPSGLHLSYSYANPYPDAAAIKSGYHLNNSTSAEMAVMADMNPGVPGLLTTTADAPPRMLEVLQTRNHRRGRGQSVMFGDGHVETLLTPFVGVARDNIYTFGPSGTTSGGAGIIGSPTHAGDSVLLPVAAVHPGAPRGMAGESSPRPRWPLYLGLFTLVAIAVLARRWVNRKRAASA